MPSDSRKKFRALIVDDEPPARRNIALLLQHESDLEIVGECGSGKEAIAAIRELVPDLVFLDVQMPECDGFDVLEMLGGQLPPAIVFVTAFDQYAIRAFEAGALDYLLKPFDNVRFSRALERAKEKIRLASALLARPERLVVKSTREISFIRISEIDFIEAEDYYVCIHVGPKRHLLRRSLADLEKELDRNAFCRIHRSTIVNLERIKKLKINPAGDYDVALENGVQLPLSRRYRRELQERLQSVAD